MSMKGTLCMQWNWWYCMRGKISIHYINCLPLFFGTKMYIWDKWVATLWQSIGCNFVRSLRHFVTNTWRKVQLNEPIMLGNFIVLKIENHILRSCYIFIIIWCGMITCMQQMERKRVKKRRREWEKEWVSEYK